MALLCLQLLLVNLLQKRSLTTLSVTKIIPLYATKGKKKKTEKTGKSTQFCIWINGKITYQIYIECKIWKAFCYKKWNEDSLKELLFDETYIHSLKVELP